MTPESKRMLGNIVLGITFAMVLFAILEMSGVIPKYVPSRELVLMAMVLSVLVRGLRRTARGT